MKKLEEIERLIEEHKKEIKEKYYVREIGIFGSYIRGDANPESDLDILVEFDKTQDYLIF